MSDLRLRTIQVAGDGKETTRGTKGAEMSCSVRDLKDMVNKGTPTVIIKVEGLENSKVDRENDRND